MSRIKGRKPYQAMNAFFGPQVAISVAAADCNGDAFNARFFALAQIQYLGLKTLAFSPAQVHAFEHLDPILGIYTAGPGMNG